VFVYYYGAIYIDMSPALLQMKKQSEDDLKAMTYSTTEQRQSKAQALREAQSATEEEEAAVAAAGSQGGAGIRARCQL
jgi:hypothetical protein